MNELEKSYPEASNLSESSLSSEEIDFLKTETIRRVMKKGRDFSIASRAITEANWLFEHPELGMQEEKSIQYLSQKLAKILGHEKVGMIGGGIYGILEGDQEEGATIFLRGDMDALPLSRDEAAHMCGHNIHMAWLIENARLLSVFQNRFSVLPFKRLVFIGEPNEEGIVSSEFGPKKMIEAGLIDKTGKPDFILGAHFAAPQPEGQVRIDKDTACYSDGRFRYILRPNDNNQGVKMVEYEFIYQVGQRWGSEQPNSVFGQRIIVDDCQSAIPETLVRVTDSKLVTEERPLRPNILSSIEEAELDLYDNSGGEILNKCVEAMAKKWGTEIEITTVPTEDGYFKITVQSKGGHVAQGGTNAKYMMAELLHNLKERHNFSIKNGNQSVEITGSLRTRAKNWQEEGKKIGENLLDIAKKIINESGENIEVDGDMPEIDNPPVYNDDNLRDAALNILTKAGIQTTDAGLPMPVAETFAFWQSELNIPGLYLAIGGGDKAELEEIKKKGIPVPEKYLHHTPAILDLIRANRAIPYGAVLSLISLELGKQFRK